MARITRVVDDVMLIEVVILTEVVRRLRLCHSVARNWMTKQGKRDSAVQITFGGCKI